MLVQLQTAVSLIYPPRCIACGGLVDSDFGLCAMCWRETEFLGGMLCDGCGARLPGGSSEQAPDAALCDDCLRARPIWSQGRAALVYAGVGRKLVLALKHGDRQEIAVPAGKWMAAQVRALVGPEVIVVPVPLHWRRLLGRRYNQSALLATQVARALGGEACVDALVRLRATPSLDGLGRGARHETLADCIAPHRRNGTRLAGREVLLVDDVMTTGATLGACARACLEGGARSVKTVVLARAQKDT